MEQLPRTLQCTGCGAMLQLAGLQLATECGYCRATLIDAQRGAAVVDAILPLSVSAAAAARAVQAFVRNQWSLTAEVRRQLADPARLRPMFVPHWAATGILRSRWKAKVGIDWSETTTRTNSQGEREKSHRNRTAWFEFEGRGIQAATRQLVSASPTLSEQASNALGPYDTGWLQAFDARLLAGAQAELPALPRAAAQEVALEEIGEAHRDTVASRMLPGDHNELLSLEPEFQVQQWELLLLPVWVAACTGQGRTQRVWVNGQTAQVAGDLDASWPGPQFIANWLAGLAEAGRRLVTR
jgi:hypothetical protein